MIEARQLLRRTVFLQEFCRVLAISTHKAPRVRLIPEIGLPFMRFLDMGNATLYLLQAGLKPLFTLMSPVAPI